MNITRTIIIAAMMAVMRADVAGAAFVERYNVSRLDMRSGMPASYVDDMVQDSNGFVWICNYGGGLLRYDGYAFRLPTAGGAAMPMGSYSCRNICEDNFKRLWVVYDDGTQVLDLKTHQRVALKWKGGDISDILNQPAVRVNTDSRGNVWLVTRAYIYHIAFTNEGGVANVLRRAYTGNVPDMVVSDVDGDGSVWITIDRGLYRLRPRQGRLEKTAVSGAFSEPARWFITAIKSFAGSLWFATNNGLYRYDQHSHAMMHYAAGTTGAGRSLSHNFVSCLAPVDNGTLLVGTLRGVNILDTATGQVRMWDGKEPVSVLNNCFVNCIMLLDNQIWVGTETEGIIRLTPWELDLRQYCHDSTPQSLSAGCVNAMYTEQDGTLWVGTVDGGLNRKTPGSQQFTHYTTQNSGLSHNSVSTLAADGDRRLWIGTWAGGINLMSLDEPGTITHLSVDAEHSGKIGFIGALAYDRYNNGMWIGANEGLYFYNLNTGKMEDPFPDCRNIRGCIGSLIESNGTLWVGCIEGAVEVNLCEKRTGGGDI